MCVEMKKRRKLGDLKSLLAKRGWLVGGKYKRRQEQKQLGRHVTEELPMWGKYEYGMDMIGYGTFKKLASHSKMRQSCV